MPCDSYWPTWKTHSHLPTFPTLFENFQEGLRSRVLGLSCVSSQTARQKFPEFFLWAPTNKPSRLAFPHADCHEETTKSRSMEKVAEKIPRKWIRERVPHLSGFLKRANCHEARTKPSRLYILYEIADWVECSKGSRSD